VHQKSERTTSTNRNEKINLEVVVRARAADSVVTYMTGLVSMLLRTV
jgi:hypothetical protein